MTTLTDLLIKHEGFVSHAYLDSEGYLTIGIGRLIDAKLNGGITRDEAMYLLHNDIIKVEKDLDNNIPWWRNLSDVRKMALTDMCFNLGITRLLNFKKMLRALQEGNWPEAAAQAKDSKWYRQVGRRGDDIIKMFVEDII